MEKENRQIKQLKTEIIRRDNSDLKDLAVKYATDFWAGAWKELLINSEGKQYGTYDQNGNIYPETMTLLNENNIQPIGSWPLTLWERVGQSQLYSKGLLLKQYWTLEGAIDELQSFIKKPEENGFGGEIILLKNETNQIVGFTAYTVNENPSEGQYLVQKRFPYQRLIVAATNEQESITLDSFLKRMFPDRKIGIFLDFAISESERGKGLGSWLFDTRIDKMAKLGAEVFVGRTIKTSPAQYNGNYIARGMEPIAYDSENPDKAIFAVTKENIKERGTK